MSGRPTLRQRLTRLRLAEGDDLDAVFPPAFGRLELVVDTLELDGRVSFPGRSLDVQARQVVVIGDEPAVIDVSGAPAEPSYAADGSDAAPDGTPEAPPGSPSGAGTDRKPADGQPGDAGGPGHDAGDVTIVAGEIIGELTLRADGSDGGNGQRGGDGVQPPRPDGADAHWRDRAAPELGSPWGGGRLQWGTWWVGVANGQPGHPARPGGSAGAPGAAGDGGDGGRVVVRTARSSPMPVASARAGTAGVVPADATPGPPSSPGRGGRNRLYYQEYSIFGAKMDEHGDDWVGSRSGHFPYYKKKFGLADRAPNSRSTAGPGTVPARPPDAVAGASGTPEVTTRPPTELAGDISPDLLDLVLVRAHQRPFDDPDLALQRCQWVLELAAGAPPGPLRELHRRAHEAVMCPWPRT